MHLVIKMITFQFLLHLIALASFFGIAISYTVNSDCGNRASEVNDWIVEAIFLFDRAANVLEYTNTPNIEYILRACLGKSAGKDEFETVRG